MDNRKLLQNSLNSLFENTAEKTSPAIAELIVDAILKQLQQKFSFLSNIRFDMNASRMEIDSSVNSIDEKTLGKAIEAIIRLIYMNLGKQAGVDFINELERDTESDVLIRLKELGIDLDLMQIEHHQFYKANINKMQNFSQTDLNLDPSKNINPTDKNNSDLFPSADEIKLLQVLQQKDADSDEIINRLHISSQKLEQIVMSLLNNDYLYYISDDEVKLTNKAISYLAQKNKN
jgi:tRNA threonylcarbamoyladenosine modification (KEOPS) complex  Pcc1 subunit